MPSQRRTAILTASLLLTLACFAAFAFNKKKEKNASDPSQMEDSRRALHALQRLTFGPRPGDAERVAAMGVDKWIDLQLHPEKIDDSTVDERLSGFRTLRMDTREIVENFPPHPVIKAVMEGRKPMPSDPVKRAVYQAQIEKLEEKRERKQNAGAAHATASTPATAGSANGPDQTAVDNAAGADSADANKTSVKDEQASKHREDHLYADLKAQELLDLPPDERMKQVLQMSPEEQRALSSSLKGQRGDEFMEGMNSKQKETLKALNNPQQVVGDELMQAKLLRAIYSERQLDEVMTDFWFNHFNVYLGKGADRYLVCQESRDAVLSRQLAERGP